MQLAKQGSSTYIRSFYLADSDEHVVISADWSAIELVLIGDMSGDPAFTEVYGQLPYGDLHTGAAADCLAVKTIPGLTEEEFREFKFNRNPNNRVLKHISTGIEMDPSSFFKLTRGTPVGKGANFSYWYSGALSTVGQTLGWSSDEMWEAVDRYRSRFAIAEKWRVDTTQEAVDYGFVTLPDGHRRVRLEATAMWARAMQKKFSDISASPAMINYGNLAVRRIQSRAKNQAVNGMIQGTCATLAKRSILRTAELVENAGLNDLVRVEGVRNSRFMMPIHDELVYSVHRDVVMDFIPLLRSAMCEHPEIVRSLPLSCNVAVGRTFRPFDKLNPAFSQIELDEAFVIDGVIGQEWEGKKLSNDKVAEVIDFISKAKVAA
jgi:DNA polymerase I-like protein with 3'-5' exonuclease and polymerase domains